MVPFYAGRQAARSGTGNLIREKVQTESPLQLHCKSRMICSGGARIQVLNYFSCVNILKFVLVILCVMCSWG
jgi:hypothetical protein